MNVSFDGVGQVCATFLCPDLTGPGVVKLTAPGTVGPCKAADDFCGAALFCRDGACTVQLSGFVTLPYSGAAPAPGWRTLDADGQGGVQNGPDGREYLVVDADETAGTVTIML